MKTQKSVSKVSQGTACRPYKDLTLKELLSRVKEISVGVIETGELKKEFYYRYSGDIYKKAVYVCRNRRDCSDMAKDILQSTFEVALEKLSSFTINDTVPENEVHYQIIAWLGKIANNLYFEHLKRFKIDSVYINDIIGNESFNFIHDDEQIEPNISSEAQELTKFLDTLPERDHEIIMTYLLYDCIETGNHLPDTEMKKLCKKYNTNSTNIRQIKTRTIKKIINLKLF